MKKSFFGWFFLLVLNAILSSCSTSPKADEAWIEGDLTGNSFSQIILEELTPEGIQKIDSTAVIHNKFKFKIPVREAGFYFLRFSSKNFISIVLKPGEKIIIKAPADSLGYPTELTGSPENATLLELNHKLDGCYKTTDSLSEIFKEYAQTDSFDSVKVSIDSAYYRMFYTHKNWLETYIRQHKNSLTCIVAFYQTLGRRSFFTAEEDFQTMKFIDENLTSVLPTNKHVVKFHALYLEQKQNADKFRASDSLLRLKNPISPIVLPSLNGNSIDITKISAPKKLLFFWNIKSMVDNPDKSLLNKKRNSEKMIGISFEEDPELWKTVIKKEFKQATHVIDTQGFMGEVAVRYSISEKNIPFYILLDSKNCVLAFGKNLSAVIH